jgi:hypothetical protein
MVYADDISLLGENKNIVKKNTEALLDASKEVGMEVNAKKTKCMFMSHRQITAQNIYIMVHPLKMGKSSDIWKRR